MRFEFTREIMAHYYRDELYPYVVEGMPPGIGKSSYVVQVIAEVKGRHAVDPKIWYVKNSEWKGDYEAVKKLTKFYPKDVVNTFRGWLDKNIREEAFNWEDAGLWLNAFEWSDPFVISFLKFLNIGRTVVGAIILSTPVVEWIVKRLRTTTGLRRVHISEPPTYKPSWFSYTHRPRMAVCYQKYTIPNKFRPYERVVFRDPFNGMMPADFYAWYKPIRRQYAVAAVQLMDLAIQRRKKNAEARGLVDSVTMQDEEVLGSVREELAKANDASVDFGELVEQKASEVS